MQPGFLTLGSLGGSRTSEASSRHKERQRPEGAERRSEWKQAFLTFLSPLLLPHKSAATVSGTSRLGGDF